MGTLCVFHIICYVFLLSSSCFCLGLNLSKHELHTWTGQLFNGFTGIKYAEAPIGELRYMPPVPFEPSWNLTSISNITTSLDGGPPCPSPYVLTQQSEDCLYLNVYTKNLVARAPVVVFIHPGGFYIFSGRPDHFGPDYLLDENVVLVTFNYRLSFLGFFSPGYKGPSVQGNAGLKDQALVLRWIAQNIHLFGGDPDNVSLMGISAGAMSVALHLVSPMSEGLFHRAIIMSGGILPQMKIPNDQIGLMHKQAELLNCSESPFECLRSASALDLAKSVYRMFEFGRDNPIYRWLPVVESCNGNQCQAFLTENDPLQKIQTGHWAKVPILTGTTRNEFATSAYELLINETLRSKWTDEFAKWAPVALHFNRDTNISSQLSMNIWEYYFNAHSSAADFEHVQQCFSDALANFPIHRLAIVASEQVPLFRYRFDYSGRYSNFAAADKESDIVEHCDDLQYIFNSKLWPRIAPSDGIDADMVRRMTSIIAGFAKTGYPTTSDVPVWPTFEQSQQLFVRIGNKDTVEQYPFNASVQWDKWFPV